MNTISATPTDAMARLTTRVASRYASPIVLYHATFPDLPREFASGVHNVTPSDLVEQVDWIARSHRCLSIDEWFAEGRPSGTAAITFDDGYLSVLRHVVPLLIDRGIPSTIFLNGAGFRGEVFWRDRVVHIVNCGLVEEFLASEPARAAGLDDLRPEDFYRGSKDPARDSSAVDVALTSFLDQRGLSDDVPRATAASEQDLVDHELVTYGNHSYRHYVPSSLDAEGQRHELEENERVLDELGVRRSRVYSVPFGDPVHVDDTTEALVREMDFVGVVFSSNGVNFRDGGTWAGLPIGQRYMAPATPAAFRFHHARLAWMPPNAGFRRAARAVRRVARR